MKLLQIIPIAAVSLMLMTTACKKDDYQTEADVKPEEFKVSMTDAPGDYEALSVEIESVEAYNNNSGWVTLNSQTQFINVLELTNGKETQIALVNQAEAGSYSKLKIKFGNEHTLKAKSSVMVGGISSVSTLTFQLGWEGPKEIELEINEQISSSQGADILIDFNVAQSIKEDGEEYVLKPVITSIKDRATGVSGEVSGSASAAILLTNGKDSISTYTNAEGKFLLRGLDPGTYKLIAYPAQEENGETLSEKHIDNVVIKKGKIKSTGTIRF